MISKIEIVIDGKKIRLSLDQAEELHEELDKLFGEKEVVHKHYRPYEYPYWPYWGTWSTSNGFGTTSAIYNLDENVPITSDTLRINVKSQ